MQEGIAAAETKKAQSAPMHDQAGLSTADFPALGLEGSFQGPPVFKTAKPWNQTSGVVADVNEDREKTVRFPHRIVDVCLGSTWVSLF